MSEKLTRTEKLEIQYKLRIYISTFSSQKKACMSFNDVSEATVIAMLSEKEEMWASISDRMWNNVGAQVGGVVDYNKLVETKNFRILKAHFEAAKSEGASFSLIGNAGWGKSYAAKWYAAMNRKNNVFYLECAEYWNKKVFLLKLLMQMGENGNGQNVPELMEVLVRKIRQNGKSLIIMDEVDKLPDYVLKFFITLYNELNKYCGFVWLSTNAIEKRMVRGIERSTIGYQELFSRIGAQFVMLKEPATDEIEQLCQVNGITDKQQIAIVVNEVRDIKGDLRRVDRNILKAKVRRASSKTAA